MKKFILLFLLILFSSCKFNNSTYINTTSTTYNYESYDSFNISLNEMYNLKDENYALYFFSYTCPACNSLKENLFNYLNNSNKIINLYLVNLFNESDEDFNKLLMANNLTYEEVISLSIGATKIEETYFKHTPSIYFINKINGVNTLNNIYLDYESINNLFMDNSLK